MRLLVDTGVFSAALNDRRRHPEFEPLVARLPGNQLNLAAQTVAELRYGALVAGWAESRRDRLERAIAATTVIQVSDALLTTVARLRFDCRTMGHTLASAAHNGDLWIAATALHVQARLVTADHIFDQVPGLMVN
ncbi:MAG: PIN domain-containing protein [Pseudonocardiaceae bacterium]